MTRPILSRSLRTAALAALTLVLAACGTTGDEHEAYRPTGAGGRYKVGAPYEVKGVWYYPQEDSQYDETGIASWYGAQFAGRKTANGEIFDPGLLTAAHKTLPMPVNVRVTNLENGKSIVARVNDRGPFKPGRIIDLSERGAELLDFKSKGVTRVRVQFLGVAELADGGQRVKGKGEYASLGANSSGARTAPTGDVESAELAPPPGSVAAAPAPAVAAMPGPVVASTVPSEEPDGTVRQMPVNSRGLIYVQAGAFLARENADRLLRRLRSIAEFKISSKATDGKVYYRVRSGPIASVEEADTILDEVLSDGQKGAQLVIE